MCCSGADHMASGDLDRIESAFAEATLDSGLWSRALNLTEIGSFGTALLPLVGTTIPGALFPGCVVWSARAEVWSGLWVAPVDALHSAIARGSLAKACHLTCVCRRLHAVKNIAGREHKVMNA